MPVGPWAKVPRLGDLRGDPVALPERRECLGCGGTLINAWRPIEVFATFMKVTGELEVIPPQRLTDVVNGVGDFLEMREAIAEPLSVNYPVLSQREARTVVAKASIIMVCPRDQAGDSGRQRPMWREKMVQPVSINTQAFSMVADVHLEPRHSLRDHLERYRSDFIPVTNVSALWVAALTAETNAMQRAFALLNPTSILSFSPR
jgi:hypothetical protein